MELTIYLTLMTLAIGLLTSISFLALAHILIFFPALYFLPKTNFKTWPKSAWALLALIMIIILSVLANQDIATNGIHPIFKTKYLFGAILSIAPFTFYFKKYPAPKKIKTLLYVFFIFTSIATISGIIGVLTGYNPLKFQVNNIERSGGLFGMLMSYAHSVAFFDLLLLGLILYKNEIKKYMNLNFLYAVWVINMIGLYSTFTRGAWLAFILAAPFFFFKKNVKWFISTGIGLIVAGALVFILAGEAVQRPMSDHERISQWKAAIAAFEERPILGYGFLNFKPLSTQIKHRYHISDPDFEGHAHNNFLEMLASTGILGASVFVLWIIFWFKEMYTRDDLMARLALPFIVAFVVGGLTQATFIDATNLFFITFFYALTQVRVHTKYT